MDPTNVMDHVVLWWLADDAKLDSATKDRLDVDSEILVSSATVWEVGIKQALGKLAGEGSLAEQVRDSGVAMLPISADPAIAASMSPRHHRDPFDRILIGQALVEGLTVMTSDRVFDAYDVPLETA
jgi:PIN domain nuclease of toxin-antitoxin system